MSIARNTAVIGGITFISRVFGFARDIVLAAALGAGPVADAFYAALRFPNLFRRLFAEGAFSQAFVPVYSKALAEHGPERADRMAAEALSAVLAATGVLTAVAILAMPWINRLLLPGYVDDAQTFALANTLTQITMPYLMAMTAATVFSGVLNARGRFIVAAAAPIVLNLALLVALFPVLARLVGHAIPAIAPWAAGLPALDQRQAATAGAIAVLVSGLAQSVWVWLGARRSGYRTGLPRPRLTADVKRIVALAAPGAVAGGALQINVMISQVLASLEEGAITYLNVADRLYQLPLGLIGIAVGVAMLPRLARLVQENDQVGARRSLDEAVALSMAFTLPAGAAILTMPHFLIDALFTRGAFTPEDARATAEALFHYGWGVPAFVLARIFAPAFFAREDTIAPMRFALVSMGLNIAFGAAFFFGLRAMGMPGFPGLALATSLAAWANVALMGINLVQRGAYGPTASALWRLSRVLLAAALLGALLAAATAYRPSIEDVFGSKERAIVVVTAIGGLLYLACLFAFRAVTVSEVRSAFRRERGPAGGGAALPGGFDG